MRLSPVAVHATVLAAALAAVAGQKWLAMDAGREVSAREPFPAPEAPLFRPALPGELTTGDGRPAEELPGSWPCFRGPARDGISREETPLAETWPADGPPRRWSIAVGEGYAGAAAHRGRVYILDYDTERRGDALRCLSLADGREIWRRWYHLPIVRSHGISRTVPAVSDRHIVTLGPLGHVLGVDAETGEARWWRDLAAEFGTAVPEWYAGQCPRIDVLEGREVAILAPGGDRGALLVAVDCETGEEVWRTPNPRALQMTHASIARMDWRGTATYVYPTTGGVVGVAARDGALLWEHPDWLVQPAIVPTPLPLGPDRLLLTAGYRAGAVLLEIRAGEAFAPTPAVVARFDPRALGADQQTPIFHADRIYAVLTKDAGPHREELACLSAEGVLLWTSGAERRFGLGPFLLAGDKLLLMDDDGMLTMARASDARYEELARAPVLEGREAWGPMALAGGLLLVRDLETLRCLDLREGAR
ncbi:MAG: PQQ-binding-like beta-propeller repeat protein [Planctomycetota bacterium]